MDNETTTPDATTAQVASVDSNPTQDTQAAQQSGIQKRIDELVAKSYEKDEQINRLTNLLQTQVVAQQQAQMQHAQSAEPADPFQGVDYTDANSVTTAFRAALKQQEAKFRAELSSVQVASAGGEVAMEAQQRGIQDPRITVRAQQLAQSWKQQGLPFVAWDAVKYAMGEAAAGELPGGMPVIRGNNGRFAPVNPTLVAPNPPPPSAQVRQKELPANFDQLNTDQQIALLENRLADKAW